MTSEEASGLKKRIMDEMSVDHSNALEKNFELAKGLIRITSEGKVDLLVKNKLTGKDQILLYLIGKLYAREADLSPTNEATNQELMDELGISKGSLLPWLKNLRDSKKIKTEKKGKYTYHKIPINLIEKTLNNINKKLNKSE